MSTITTISIQKENLSMKYDLIQDDADSAYLATKGFLISTSFAYICMNAMSTDVISFRAQQSMGTVISAQILYSNQVIHSANLDLPWGEPTTYVNLVPQS